MSKQYAKEHSLDIPHISCIEFPLKVNNVEKALEMVGGRDSIIKSCLDEDANPLELRLTKDIYHHPINAKVNKTENVLLKLSVPKKEYEKSGRNIRKTLESLQEVHKKPVHVTPVAIINKTFRFREMSDFQYQTKSSRFVQQVNESIHDMNYSKIKELKFKQDQTPWEPESDGFFDLPPLPRFSSIPLPFQYNYKKNAATVVKEGKITTKNKHIKLHSIIIKWSDDIPKQPSAELVNQLEIFQSEPLNPFYRDVLETLNIIKDLFEKKPIWIRKHLEAILPIRLKQCLRYALPQLSYSYTKGPWRQCYIKHGTDPKSSNQYSRYQTEGFRVPNYGKKVPKDFVSENKNEVSSIFIFNGSELPSTLSFQIENLQDPHILGLISNAKFREECDFYDGWYDTLTMLRIRRLMRYKLRCLVEGTKPEAVKVDYIMNKLQIHESEKEEDEEKAELESEVEDEEENLNEDYELDVSNAKYKEILEYIEKTNPRGAHEISELSNILRI